MILNGMVLQFVAQEAGNGQWQEERKRLRKENDFEKSMARSTASKKPPEGSTAAIRGRVRVWTGLSAMGESIRFAAMHALRVAEAVLAPVRSSSRNSLGQ